MAVSVSIASNDDVQVNIHNADMATVLAHNIQLADDLGICKTYDIHVGKIRIVFYVEGRVGNEGK